MKFDESRLESLIIELIQDQSIKHYKGENIEHLLEDVIIKDDFSNF